MQYGVDARYGLNFAAICMSTGFFVRDPTSLTRPNNSDHEVVANTGNSTFSTATKVSNSMTDITGPDVS